MPLVIVASQVQLVAAINGFSASYHADYLHVRDMARLYINSPTQTTADPLANQLRAVLNRWGAGKRKAPNVREPLYIQESLLNPQLHALLARFARMPINILALVNNYSQRVVGDVNTAMVLGQFDTDLYTVLSMLSTNFFINNTNVTYPMKSLLLLTGFMPALDSQVRGGLGSAGFSGTKVTRFLMPVNINSTEAKKITRLPFFLADCYASNAPLLEAAAAASHYPWLASEPGRLFDVLLFMQGAAPYPIFTLNHPNPNWFQLE
jgi:hypothetical protein